MSQFGVAADNSSCPGVQPADKLQCNVMPCDFCSLTNCAGQVAPVLRCGCAILVHLFQLTQGCPGLAALDMCSAASDPQRHQASGRVLCCCGAGVWVYQLRGH